MRKCSLAVVTLAGVITGAGTAQQQALAVQPLVLDRVTVVDVEHGALRAAQRVVVVGTRIQAVGAAATIELPAGARIVDAEGKYLIPGLWDMHRHHTDDIKQPLLVAQGVTGFRDAGSEVPLDVMVQWRREVLAGTRVGPPRQIFSGQAISEGRVCERSEATGLGTCVAGPADARHLVDSLKAAGADMIKVRKVSKELYYVIAAEARRIGIPFGGHVAAEPVLEAADSGTAIIDHFYQPDVTPAIHQLCDGRSVSKLASIDRCAPVAEAFRRHGMWLVPTLAVSTKAYGASRRWHVASIIDYFDSTVRDSLAMQLAGGWLRAYVDPEDSTSGFGAFSDTLGTMHISQRVGLPILAGTDMSALGEYALHVELAVMVAEGLTPLTALQSATLNPAKFLHATDSLGTVAPGKLADLVLLDANPLADITNTTAIYAVVANGRYFDRAALDNLAAGEP